MRALLDTHVFLCAVSEPERLSESATKVIQSGANELFLSAASLWEISIKIETGKLPFLNLRTVTCEINYCELTFRHSRWKPGMPWS